MRSGSALPAGRALDVACGAGRNALFLAAARTTPSTRSTSPKSRSSAAAPPPQSAASLFAGLAADLDADPDAALPAASYGLIVWVRYVNAALMPHVLQRLEPGGHLVCEQHLVTDADVVGPQGGAFRLQPNELRNSAAGLSILDYREGLVVDPDGRTAALAQLVARRTA